MYFLIFQVLLIFFIVSAFPRLESVLKKRWNSGEDTPSYLLRVTKVLVNISQFEFLVMTEKYFCL